MTDIITAAKQFQTEFTTLVTEQTRTFIEWQSTYIKKTSDLARKFAENAGVKNHNLHKQDADTEKN
jgi:hypothetical protein